MLRLFFYLLQQKITVETVSLQFPVHFLHLLAAVLIFVSTE